MTRSAAVVLIEDYDNVRLLTLNRPGALNAFNDELYDGMTSALADASADDSVAVVVVTGAGRAFSAGQDLAELGAPPHHADGARHGFIPFVDCLEAFPKPLLAAVNGVAIGVGLTLLPHCDIVLIANEARLRAPFASLGLCAEAGSSVLLPARVGVQRTAELLYTSRWLDAATAVEWGLALRRHDRDDLLPEALKLAGSISRMPLSALVSNKRLLVDARLDEVRQARRREQHAFGRLVGGPANAAAMAALRNGR